MKLSNTDRKKFRVRKKLKKVSKPDRFRLSVFRSAKNISAQIIDDKNNVTLLSVSSIEKDIKAINKKNKTELSKIVAEKISNVLGIWISLENIAIRLSLSKHEHGRRRRRVPGASVKLLQFSLICVAPLWCSPAATVPSVVWGDLMLNGANH